MELSLIQIQINLTLAMGITYPPEIIKEQVSSDKCNCASQSNSSTKWLKDKVKDLPCTWSLRLYSPYKSSWDEFASKSYRNCIQLEVPHFFWDIKNMELHQLNKEHIIITVDLIITPLFCLILLKWTFNFWRQEWFLWWTRRVSIHLTVMTK